MLANQARNLSHFDFPARQQLTATLAAMDRCGFRVAELDGQTRKRFSGQFRAAVGRTNRWPMIAIVKGCTTNVRRAGPGSQAEHPVCAAFELLLPRRKGDHHVPKAFDCRKLPREKLFQDSSGPKTPKAAEWLPGPDSNQRPSD